MRTRLTVVLCTILLGICACHHSSDSPPIILIAIDSLRPDHMGCYGYKEKTTPLIDLLARNGTVFNNAFSTAPWPQPAYASIFTGLYPSAHQVVEEGAFVKPGIATLAAQLKQKGYKTVGIVGNPALGKDRGYSRGFDQYFSVPNANAEAVVDLALNWLNANSAEPFFLFLEFDDPQPPYSAPTSFVAKHYPKDARPIHGGVMEITNVMTRWPADEAKTDLRSLKSLYDAEIDYTDQSLSKLYEEIQIKILDRKAVIILTSSNGEEFMEHGLMGHGYSLYNEQIRVPLIFYGQKQIKEKFAVNENVSLADLYPTILNLAGAQIPEGVTGRSILPLMAKPSASETHEELSVFAKRTILAETSRAGPDRVCVIRGTKKFVYSPVFEINGRTFGCELYDFARDPDEKNNLLPSSPGMAAPFENAIDESGLYQRKRLWTILFGHVKKPVVFSGLVSTSGEFTSLYKRRLSFGVEGDRIVSKDYALVWGDKALRFGAVGGEDADGFHFLVEPVGAIVKATLLVNGAKNPSEIVLGSEKSHPPEVPFFLESRYDGLPSEPFPGYSVTSEDIWVSKAPAARIDAAEGFPLSPEFVEKLRRLVKNSDKSLEEMLAIYMTGQGAKPSKP